MHSNCFQPKLKKTVSNLINIIIIDSSVTMFGTILRLGPISTCLSQFHSIRQNFDPTMPIFIVLGKFWLIQKAKKDKIIHPSGYTDFPCHVGDWKTRSKRFPRIHFTEKSHFSNENLFVVSLHRADKNRWVALRWKEKVKKSKWCCFCHSLSDSFIVQKLVQITKPFFHIFHAKFLPPWSCLLFNFRYMTPSCWRSLSWGGGVDPMADHAYSEAVYSSTLCTVHHLVDGPIDKVAELIQWLTMLRLTSKANVIWEPPGRCSFDFLTRDQTRREIGAPEWATNMKSEHRFGLWRQVMNDGGNKWKL